MASTLMVLIDGSDHSHKAFQKALASKKDDDHLLLVHSCQFPEQFIPAATPFGGIAIDPKLFEVQKKLVRDQANKVCAPFRDECKKQNVSNVTTVVLESHANPKDAVCEYAKEKEVTTIFVGTRGLGALKKMILGSFSDYIVHHAECDVVVVKH